MKHNFEEKRQQRIDRYKEIAAAKVVQSDRFFEQASKIASYIPMGQPILIGHHSEKKHRNDKNKIDNSFRNGNNALKTASYYEQKAAAAENNAAIFADDPNAIPKLQEKIASLQSLQEHMKEVNKCVKAKKKDKYLLLPGATESKWVKLITPDFCGRVGYPAYALQNNNQNITRLKKRLAELQCKESAVISTKEVQGVQGLKVIENVEANRIQFVFDEKPSEDIRNLLKKWAFRWSPNEGAWQRHLNGNGKFAAQQVLKELNNIN